MKYLNIKGFFLLFVLVFSLEAQEIQLLTEESAPHQMRDGEYAYGIAYDIVGEMQKRVGNSKKIIFYPWNRGYNITLENEGFALFSTVRTEHREKLFKWVGPIVEEKLIFYKNINNKKVFKTMEDAKRAKSIATTKNDSIDQLLTKKGFTNLQAKIGGNYKINCDKVVTGKAELWSSGFLGGHYRIKELGLQDKIVATKVPSYYHAVLYIAFHKDTDDKVIQRWQSALDSMKKDGSFDAIYKKYR